MSVFGAGRAGGSSLAALVTALVLAGCGSGSAAPERAPAVPAPPYSVVVDGGTHVSGGTAAQRRVLREVVRGIEHRLIPRVRIGGPPPEYARGRRGARAAWLYFDGWPPAADEPGRRWWRSRLIVAAFAERSRALALPAVGGASDPGGSSVCCPERRRLVIGSPDRMARAVARRVRELGLELVSIRFVKPLGHAPVVVARTGERGLVPGCYVPDGHLPDERRRYEGLWFEVRDPTGEAVFFAGRATRDSSGVGTTGLSRPVGADPCRRASGTGQTVEAPGG